MSAFISYASANTVYAERIREFFTRSGIGVDSFYAPKGVKPGRDFEPVIRRAVGEMDSMIVIMSQESAASEWVQMEVEAAEALGKPIIPMAIGRWAFDTPLKDLPPWMQRIRNKLQLGSLPVEDSPTYSEEFESGLSTILDGLYIQD